MSDKGKPMRDLVRMRQLMILAMQSMNRLSQEHDLDTHDLLMILFNLVYDLVDGAKADKNRNTIELIKEYCDGAKPRRVTHEEWEKIVEENKNDT